MIEDEFPLVELKEKFGDIKVLYNGQDILGSNKDIKIVSLSLENSGRTILQSYFDQNIPFGLAFENSRVLSVVPTSETSDYLRENLFMEEQATNYERGRVIFKKPILEKGAKASFKVYLLQDRGHPKTAIAGLGKISGLQKISVSRADRPIAHQGKTGEAVAIGFASGYGGMLCLMFTLLGIMFYRERWKRRKRIKKSAAFCAKEEAMTQSQKKIVESYEKGWRPYYIRTIRALAAGDQAMDFPELISRHLLKRSPFLLVYLLEDFLLPGRLRQFQPLHWSPEIFTLVDHSISFNNENRAFLLRFVTEVEEISVEQSA